MPYKFEPYKKQGREHEFSNWDYKPLKNKNEEIAVVDEKAAFLAECERLRQEAIKKGYEEGLQQAQKEISEQKKELAGWFDQILNPIKFLDDRVTQEIIQTILWMCQYCISVELSVNPDKLRDLINEIKTELPSLNNHRMLAMHPTDLEWVKTNISENEIPGLHAILVADSTLSRGDFYLQGDFSELDGRIHTRIATLFAKYITKDNVIAPMHIQD